MKTLITMFVMIGLSFQPYSEALAAPVEISRNSIKGTVGSVTIVKEGPKKAYFEIEGKGGRVVCDNWYPKKGGI